MRKELWAIGLALMLNTCGTRRATTEGSAVSDPTLAQMDSIGRSYKPTTGKYGGTVRLPLDSDPNGLCPTMSNSAYSQEVLGYIFEGLITLDPATLEHKPHIAKKWDVSPDGLTWVFHMRDDVLFSDGVKLTARDVEFTFNDVIYSDRLRSPLNYNFRVKGEKISVAAIDSFTVEFRLPHPFAPFLTVVGVSIMPRHKCAKYADDGTLEAFLSNSVKPEDLVGSGPFVLEKVELGQRILLRRNPNYWKRNANGDRLPYIDKIVLLIIKEPNVAMLKFKNGEIDHFELLGEHYPILKPLEKERSFRVFRVGPRWSEGFFVFNQNNQKGPNGAYFLEPGKQKWFRNKNFRKACAHAMNYDEIISIVYNGLAYPPDGIWGEHKGFFHNPDAVTYAYDTTRARELLELEGFVDRDDNGVLEDNNGNPVEFTLMSSSGVQIIKDVYEIVRKDLERIGLKVHLSLIEFNNLMDKTTNTFDWDVVAYGLGGIMDPHFGKSSVTSTSFRYVINPQRKDEVGGLITKKDRPWELRINDIFEVAVSEMDKDKRKALYDEWQEIAMDQCLKVYLPVREVVLGVSDRFGNIHLTGHLALVGSMLHNIDEIYIKEDL